MKKYLDEEKKIYRHISIKKYFYEDMYAIDNA